MGKYYYETKSPLGTIYKPEGWIDMEKLTLSRYNRVVIVAGRGTGKTYGTFDTIYKHKVPSVYLRRTQDQFEICLDNYISPVYDYCSQSGNTLCIAKIKKNSGGVWDNYVEKDGVLYPEGEPLIFMAGLSTAYKVRSMSALRYKWLFYDEFIGESHERPIKNEVSALLNFRETINRNRELTGEPPLKVIMMSNSNDIYNVHLLDMHLVPVLERMRKDDKGVYIDEERSLLVIYPMHSPISEAKANTSMYTEGGEMADMAVNNEFAYNDMSEIRRMNLKEYKLLALVGKVAIYGHKSKPSNYYCTQVISGATKQVYADSDIGLFQFRAHWKARLLKSRLKGLLNFSDAETAGVLTSYLDL